MSAHPPSCLWAVVLHTGASVLLVRLCAVLSGCSFLFTVIRGDDMESRCAMRRVGKATFVMGDIDRLACRLFDDLLDRGFDIFDAIDELLRYKMVDEDGTQRAIVTDHLQWYWTDGLRGVEPPIEPEVPWRACAARGTRRVAAPFGGVHQCNDCDEAQ